MRFQVQYFNKPVAEGPGISGEGWIVMDTLTGYPMGRPRSKGEAQEEAKRLNG